MCFYKNSKTILLVIFFITIFYIIPRNITASIKVDKSQKNINYLAYSEFANEYAYGGELKTNGYALVEADNILQIYESSCFYQFDSSLKQKSMIEMKDLNNVDNQSYKNDNLIRNTSNANVKIIPSVMLNKKYFLIQKKYTTKEKDLENLRIKIADLKNEEKDNLYYLQSVTTDEQREKNKLILLKQTLQTQAINDQLNDIRKKYVSKRVEIERKITENFQKRNILEFKEQLTNKKEYVINIKLLDTSFIDNNFDSTEVPDTSEIVEGENFLFPENFWNINLFDLDLITTDRKGLFYGYEKNDNRIYVFDYSGDLLSSFMLPDNPLKIYVDKNQIIYVVSQNKIAQYKLVGYVQNYLRPINNNLNVIGSINSETTWSGTISLVGETRVEAGAVLTILPGTKIVFSKSGISALNILGTIKAIGNKDNQIIFKSDTPYPLGEVNIYSEENEEVSIFTYCRFESMQYGLRIYDASPEISHCIFISNEDALWYQGNKPEYINKCNITKNIFKDNLVGILITFLVEGSNPTIKYNNIYENKKTNLMYKNKINLNVEDNYWGNTEIDKIRQTIINEANKDVKTDIVIDPVLLVPFDIYSEEE